MGLKRKAKATRELCAPSGAGTHFIMVGCAICVTPYSRTLGCVGVSIMVGKRMSFVTLVGSGTRGAGVSHSPTAGVDGRKRERNYEFV